jgi:hypothetical protein
MLACVSIYAKYQSLKGLLVCNSSEKVVVFAPGLRPSGSLSNGINIDNSLKYYEINNSVKI